MAEGLAFDHDRSRSPDQWPGYCGNHGRAARRPSLSIRGRAAGLPWALGLLWGSRTGTSRAPLADRLFAIEGVIGVLIAHDKVTVTLEGQSGIPVLGTAIRTVRALVGGRSA